MKSGRGRYYGHRFPPEIISYAVWVYHRFCLSFRDVTLWLGRSVAFRAAAATLDYAFTKLGRDRVGAITHPRNELLSA